MSADRKPIAIRKPAGALLQGWALAAMILTAAPLPASAQEVWFDPDIPAGQAIWGEMPGDDQAIDGPIPDCGKTTASLHAPHQVA